LELEGLPLLLLAVGFHLLGLILLFLNLPTLFALASIVFVILWASIVRKSFRARTQEEEPR
jgi:hypothetical protein